MLEINLPLNNETKLSANSTNKRQNREESILSSAIEIFVRKGYEQATTREIALNAKCAEGLIFKYFKDKSTLLNRILERGIERAEQELLELPESFNSLEEDLFIFSEWIMRSYLKEPKIFQIYFAQRLQGDESMLASAKREEFFTKKRMSVFRTRMKKHTELNLINKRISIDELFHTIQSYVLYVCIFEPIIDTSAKSDKICLKVKNFIFNLVYGIQFNQ